MSRLIFNRSDEALLLTILGVAVLAAGLAEGLQISAAVGALLAGIVLSGPAAESARGLLAPLRDLFAAIFFAFVGLSVDPGSIPPTIGGRRPAGARHDRHAVRRGLAIGILGGDRAEGPDACRRVAARSG